MAENSLIEWTDHTFNGWIGCTKISPACDNCYAERMMDKRLGRAIWGHGQARSLTSDDNWKQPLAWDRKAAKAGVRAKVFANSLSDVFDNEVPDAWRDHLFATAALTPNLDWLILTKRPKVAYKYFTADAVDYAGKPFGDPGMGARDSIRKKMVFVGKYQGLPGWPLPNVWLGVTVENQKMAELRIPILLDTPAAGRFVSSEPLLGRIRTDGWLRSKPSHTVLDWWIAGGESGPGARPMHPDWARSLRDQCKAADVPFFFKQWGTWGPVGLLGNNDLSRVGKARAGHLLDGQEHHEFPQTEGTQ